MLCIQGLKVRRQGLEETDSSWPFLVLVLTKDPGGENSSERGQPETRDKAETGLFGPQQWYVPYQYSLDTQHRPSGYICDAYQVAKATVQEHIQNREGA